ncbi:MAG TPA: hypothetical protein VF712_03215 [Thermoleophilaceae bacterium]
MRVAGTGRVKRPDEIERALDRARAETALTREHTDLAAARTELAKAEARLAEAIYERDSARVATGHEWVGLWRARVGLLALVANLTLALVVAVVALVTGDIPLVEHLARTVGALL